MLWLTRTLLTVTQAATKGSSTSKYPTVDTVETFEKTIQQYLQCPAMLYPEVCVVPDFKAIEAHHPSKIWIGITVKGKLQLPPGLSEEIYGKLSAGPQRRKATEFQEIMCLETIYTDTVCRRRAHLQR